MDVRLQLLDAAPWLAAPELGVCIVGSHALAHAGRAAGTTAGEPADVDLAWALDVAEGSALLQRHGVFVPTTTGNQERGTVAMKLAGMRIEITTFRAGSPDLPLGERMRADLGERDMTIGALAVELATGDVHDPFGGLQDFAQRRIVPVGDPVERVREHAIRWLRYFRKAHQLGFTIDPAIRALGDRLEPNLLLQLPPEAVALELRAILGKCASPGRCLLDLHETGVLATVSPEIARQFDGRPAGPQRWHPEVSQGLHLILALEWAAANCAHLDERDRNAVLFAVLCHDFGKGDTEPSEFPRHRGHERRGRPHIDALAKRWPGLVDQRALQLAHDVADLHLDIRHVDGLRSGTLARIYETHFRARDYPIEPFALAVAADSAGRLGLAHRGAEVHARVRADLHMLREACATVDAGALRQRHPDDLDAFRAALHEARARAIAAARRRAGSPGDGDVVHGGVAGDDLDDRRL